jgi:hypothetical protein
MAKHSRKRRSHKRRSHKRRSHKQQKGGGYTEVLSATAIYPGQQVHQQYTGPGYDSPPVPMRPGTMTDIGSLRNPGGLPGLSPPGRMLGGANQLGSGGPVILDKYPGTLNPFDSPQPIEGSLVALGNDPARLLAAKPALYHGGKRQQKKKQQQSGGRWGAVPEMGPLNQSNGVGTIGAPFARVGCETGTYNRLNPDPNGIQTMSTAPGTVPGWTGFTDMMGRVAAGFGMKGGKRSTGKRSKKGRMCFTKRQQQQQQQQQSGGRFVGDVASMAYYAPTAGYGNYPMSPVPVNNPGVLMQVGYPARHLNEACIKTS